MFGSLDACGKSIRTAWVSNGAVIMKITSSTSMTSTSGIMLISAMGVVFCPDSKLPNAITPPPPALRARRLPVAGKRAD